MCKATNRSLRFESPERHRIRMDKKHAKNRAFKAAQKELLAQQLSALKFLGVPPSKEEPPRANNGHNTALLQSVTTLQEMVADKKAADKKAADEAAKMQAAIDANAAKEIGQAFDKAMTKTA